MNNNRDMFYNSFGYQGNMPIQFMPIPNNMMQNNPMMYQNTFIPYNTQYNTGYDNNTNNSSMYNPINDINKRLTKLETNVNKLAQRVTRLENSTNNTTNIYNNDPDTNLYML